ncbi:Zinc/iron permease [Cladochytrium replicatum]|nr:Zinc/iron permease [Cladochytrium replicatum]
MTVSNTSLPLVLSVLFLLAAQAAAQDAAAAAPTGEPTAAATEADACAVEKEGDYDLPLHIGAIFIIMGISFLGTAVPLLGRYLFNGFSTKSLPFQALKMFSTGVIICTAFVHMFLPATELLADKCLPAGFIESDYEAWAGVFAIIGLFATHLIQVLIRRVTYNYARKHPETQTSSSTLENGGNVAVAGSQSHAHEDDDGHGHGHHIEYQMIKERHSTVYVLELGVASHSVIIGIILGFARGAEFSALLIALCFHQFFEGTALSSVVVGARFSSLAPIALMVAMYSLSTPLGIAIGVGLEAAAASSLNLAAQNLTTGILEAFGAGILLYDALVNIMANHFAPPVKVGAARSLASSETSDAVEAKDKSVVKNKLLRNEDETEGSSASFVESSTVSQVVQIGALWFGALVMAVIGKWGESRMLLVV